MPYFLKIESIYTLRIKLFFQISIYLKEWSESELHLKEALSVMFALQTQCAPVCNLKGILPQMLLSLPRFSGSWYKCPSVFHRLVFPYSTGQGLELQLNKRVLDEFF